MKRFIAFLLAALLPLPLAVIAKDVNVRGYDRKDGAYIRSHVRSASDSFKWNNYGPSRNDQELMSPRLRDADRDGTPNFQDRNDDSDQITDDQDASQY